MARRTQKNQWAMVCEHASRTTPSTQCREEQSAGISLSSDDQPRQQMTVHEEMHEQIHTKTMMCFLACFGSTKTSKNITCSTRSRRCKETLFTNRCWTITRRKWTAPSSPSKYLPMEVCGVMLWACTGLTAERGIEMLNNIAIKDDGGSSVPRGSAD